MPTPRRRPRLAGSLLAALLLTVPTACGGSDEPGPGAGEATSSPSASTSGSTSASASPSGSAEPSASAPAGPATYVALGDSYTAAPLVGETADEACLRSTTNYPALVADELGVVLDDRSCSGADTTALIGVQQTLQGATVPAQFDALTEETTLVTIGMGGNDFGLFTRLLSCAQYRSQDPSGSPCRTELGPEGARSFESDLDKLGPRLESVITGIRDRSPEAEVVVVGYPQMIPPDATCPDLLPLAEGDYDFVAELNQRLVDVQERAARQAEATYVDVYAASDGHDVCSDDPWINGAQTIAGTALAFHPLAAEQEAVAELVVEAVGKG